MIYCINPLCPLHCHPQYIPSSRRCRCCKQSIDPPPKSDSKPATFLPVYDGQDANPFVSDPLFWLPFFIWFFRIRSGHSQRSLSVVIDHARTYISKVERADSHKGGQWLLPLPRTMVRLAESVGLSFGELMWYCEWMAAGADPKLIETAKGSQSGPANSFAANYRVLAARLGTSI